ncbi:uncharacterized protein BJ171DRAFT_39379 [Polychytrium aggregatum]|uniref:uncharacterized protein n=1 Tax=Polychytrium aggregatum TaxID=110093 RepID=UPI0022FDF5D2|nr:uncharacterized protein BJ171DRAFT_39379 [Polychytrium aggregatum]KAI9206010.1 hypothetical protein BJ171DRAFT_39379 [Polychytrium aggregatum]
MSSAIAAISLSLTLSWISIRQFKVRTRISMHRSIHPWCGTPHTPCGSLHTLYSGGNGTLAHSPYDSMSVMAFVQLYHKK